LRWPKSLPAQVQFPLTRSAFFDLKFSVKRSTWTHERIATAASPAG